MKSIQIPHKDFRVREHLIGKYYPLQWPKTIALWLTSESSKLIILKGAIDDYWGVNVTLIKDNNSDLRNVVANIITGRGSDYQYLGKPDYLLTITSKHNAYILRKNATKKTEESKSEKTRKPRKRRMKYVSPPHV